MSLCLRTALIGSLSAHLGLSKSRLETLSTLLIGLVHGWGNLTHSASHGHGPALYTLIENAKLNGSDPQAWLADVLERLSDYSARCIDEMLPWNWTWFRPHQIAA